MSEICMIMAIGPHNVIGKGDKLAWHSKNDFYHFKKQTKGYPCLFGDVTFDGLPSKPLKNRFNIVASFKCKKTKLVTTDNGCYVEVPNIETGLELVKNYDKVFICGGKGVYEYCLKKNLINSIYLTYISTPDNSLEYQINDNLKDYVKFPVDLEQYTKDWDTELINYTDSELVSEKVKCKFIKFKKKNTD